VITTQQAAEYLAALGFGLPPSFILQAAVDKVAPAEAAMVSAGYSAADQVLVQSMAVAIIASAGSPPKVQSQGAPSGASRSFKHDDQALTALRRDLAALDTAGTVAALITPDPSVGTFLAVIC